MRRNSEIESYSSAASVEFDMGDWDHYSIHFTPSNTSNALIEETLDAGATWLQVSTVATVAATVQRIAASQPIAARCRLRVAAGTTGAVRIQKRRQ